MFRDNVENGLQVRSEAISRQQFFLSIDVLIHDIDQRRSSFLFLFLIKIDNSVANLNNLIDVLIPYEQKLDILEILLIDLQLLIDQVIELK